MIIYLRNNEIDRGEWDKCILNSPRVKPYAFSWYLDIMAPGWQALIDDDYDSVFPLPGFSRFGIKYVATPVFLQQLGAYSPDKNPVDSLNEFIEYMPDFYRLIDLCVGYNITDEGYKVKVMANYELDLTRPYVKLFEKFSQHCRRNIETSAKRKPELSDNINPEELINLFITNRGRDIKGIKPRDYSRLNNLMQFCMMNKKGRIMGARDERGKVIFGIFLVEVTGCKTMLFVVNSSESREKRTGYYVINELIKEYSSTRNILDFAGSSIPSVAAFMESFGSRNVPFFRIYRNTLPWPIRFLKQTV